ncbi:unnamed protein product, partial [Mesorhabditis belari]|uniref:Transcription elongation factor 1 homolog n=1 Tax=Mesorhabditis belari TaxID=2138241 RepID=A0AAF3EPY4_9BILA
MGKKKSSRKPPPKAKIIVPLDTQFNCPFCNHEKVCEVKMDRDRMIFRQRLTICRSLLMCIRIGLMHVNKQINNKIDAFTILNYLNISNRFLTLFN